MSKKWVIIFLLFNITLFAFTQSKDLNNVIERLTGNVISFLQEKRVPSLSIISLKNTTQLSDNAIQKLYQFIVYRLESNPNIKFKDSMFSFVNGRGQFNLKRNRDIRYLMAISFIRNKSKIGIGITLFSVNLDKPVFTKYLEWNAFPGEIDFLNIEEKKFIDFGFNKIIEIDAKEDLLDMKAMKNNIGDQLYYFYYYDSITIFKKENNVLKKKKKIDLQTGNEFFPVIKREGRMFFYTFKGIKYMIIGNNYSKNSRVFIYNNNVWKNHSKIKFMPFETFLSNGEMYFIGGQYVIGKNYFKNKLILKSINGTLSNTKEGLYKTIENFYSISFFKEGDKIDSMYTLDINYNFINYGANFEIKNKDTVRSGFAFTITDNRWIVKTAFTKENDKLMFFKINEIEKKPKYVKKIKGEVLFVNNGNWNNSKGVWIYIKKKMYNYFVYKLQFWSKKNDK